jgi:hypothetical protein
MDANFSEERDTPFPSFPDSEGSAPVTMEMIQAALNEDTLLGEGS